jgi:S-DNA-T family DNA segregation ATPase FtsK/SpoIIIE
VRLQGVFVSDEEIKRIVGYWRGFSGDLATSSSVLDKRTPDILPPSVPLKQMPIWEEIEEEEVEDKLYHEAVDLVRRRGKASISMLQRRLRIGYTRAARLIDNMEAKGIIGPPEGGAHTRQILDYGPAAPPVDED